MEYKVDYLRPRDFQIGEDWSDVYLEVKNIRRGEVFFECDRGINYKLTALTSARRINDGFYCLAETVDKEKIEIFMSDKTSHPGPNLFREPQYITEYKNELIYELK